MFEYPPVYNQEQQILMKKEVEDTYKEEEYTRPMTAYRAYFNALTKIFDMSIVNSFADLGCNNGRLIETLKENNPHVEVVGYDYFEWSKQYAAPIIKNVVHIADLAKPFTFEKAYDMVNCSEVGEHIEKEGEQDFIDNLSKAAKDILFVTWSNQHEDHDGQHLNPQPKDYVIREIEKRGLVYWKEAADALREEMKNTLDGFGYQWWPHDILVFKRRMFAPIASQYFVQGINTDNKSHHVGLTDKGLIKQSLQQSFISLTEKVKWAASNNKGYSILRASDGDFFFLRAIPKGSAKPGNRGTLLGYDKINTPYHQSLFWHHDLITTAIEHRERKDWRSLVLSEFIERLLQKAFKRNFHFVYQNKYWSKIIEIKLKVLSIFGIIPRLAIFFHKKWRGEVYAAKAKLLASLNAQPLEAVYALVSTKWIFKNFPTEIGIIAGREKMEVIKELEKRDMYRTYLGITSFAEYVEVPQKGAADDIDALAQKLIPQIKASKAKIFLVGAGHAKLGLVSLLKNECDKVFIDAGAGIDAIAGIVCQERPYFANWTNYRVKTFNYDKIDFMDQGNPAWNNKEYKTITIE